MCHKVHLVPLSFASKPGVQLRLRSPAVHFVLVLFTYMHLHISTKIPERVSSAYAIRFGSILPLYVFPFSGGNLSQFFCSVLKRRYPPPCLYLAPSHSASRFYFVYLVLSITLILFDCTGYSIIS